MSNESAEVNSASVSPATPAADPNAAPLDPPPSNSRVSWAAIQRPGMFGFLFTVGALLAIVLGMAVSNLSTILIYIMFALFAALGLNPAVDWLMKRHITRAWSIVIVFLIFTVIIAGVLGLIIPVVVEQITAFVTNIPNLISEFQATDFYAWLQATFGANVGDLLDELQRFVTNPGNIATIGGGVFQVGMTVANTVSGLIIILVLSLYFIASLPAMKAGFYRLMPARNRPIVEDMTEQITSSVGSYLIGMVTLAFFNAIVTLILQLILGLPFPLLLAVISFCITLIPLIGSVLFLAIGTVLALFTSPLSALIFAVVYLIYIQIEAYVLTPKVMNKAISVPGALVVIGALVGGTLLGLLGALIAIPVTASILLIIKKIYIPKQDAKVN